MDRSDLHELNRWSGNAATLRHNMSKKDQAGFFRGGGSTLFEGELELLGNVRGSRLLHLLCDSGQDTLSPEPRSACHGAVISDDAEPFH